MSLRAVSRPSAEAPSALASGSRRWAAQSLNQGPQVCRASTRPTAQLRPDAPGQVGVGFGPEPAGTGARDRDPRRDPPRADDHAPVLAVGVRRVRSHWWDVDPGNHRGIDGQHVLDFFETGDLACQFFVPLDELGLEFTQGNAGQRSLALQFLEPFRSLGLVEVLGRILHELVEFFELGGQFAESGSFGWGQFLVLTRSQFVEQAATQIFFERLPRLGRLTEPGENGSQNGARRIVGSGTFQTREGDSQPRLLEAIDGTP